MDREMMRAVARTILDESIKRLPRTLSGKGYFIPNVIELTHTVMMDWDAINAVSLTHSAISDLARGLLLNHFLLELDQPMSANRGSIQRYIRNKDRKDSFIDTVMDDLWRYCIFHPELIKTLSPLPSQNLAELEPFKSSRAQNQHDMAQ